MDIEFETTVLGGLPVTICAVASEYDNSDCGFGGAGDLDDWYIAAIGGKPCKKSPAWLYARIEDAGEEGRIGQEAEEALFCA